MSDPRAPSHRRRRSAPDAAAGGEGPPPHERFLRLDRERAEREWRRYEGTSQRELFRQLRERFLERHRSESGWGLDLGAGPGRFTERVGGPRVRRVALDLSWSMLRVGREIAGARRAPTSVRVRGDGLRAPFASGAFAEVALLGNTLGFEGSAGDELLGEAERLLAPAGRLLVEVAPGPGERSVYLRRLPPTAVRRLLAAPVRALLPRLEREGYRVEPPRHEEGAFRRWEPRRLLGRWERHGWAVREVMAVAPALGPDPERIEAAAQEARAWEHLLELEEAVGRLPGRWPAAAAVLLAAERPAERPNHIERADAS